MNLLDTIESDLTTALKSHDEITLSVLRLIKTSLTNYEKLGKDTPDDSVALNIIQKEIKQRQDTINQLEKTRPEMIKKDKKTIQILTKYLPEQLSDQELETIVSDAINKTGATTAQDMGKVIGVVMAQAKGKADGATVSQLVRTKLS